MIKAILFDCWDTLFYTDKKPHPFTLFAEKLERSFDDYEYLKKFEKNLMIKKTETTQESVINLLNDLNILAEENLVEELVFLLEEGHNSAVPFPETIQVLKKLKEKYRLGLITNTSYPSFKSLDDKYQISELFDTVVTSFDKGLIKPDKGMFQSALAELNIKPEEAIMVGDSYEDDVLASEKIGIMGLLIDRNDKYVVENKIKDLSSLLSLKY